MSTKKRGAGEKSIKIEKDVKEESEEDGDSEVREKVNARRSARTKRKPKEEEEESDSSSDKSDKTSTKRSKRETETKKEVSTAVASSTTSLVDEARVRVLSNVKKLPKLEREDISVVYWMSREQRVKDNWGLLYAQELAIKHKATLRVCFCLVPRFLEATIRQFGFMLKGLKNVEEKLRDLDIPFHLLIGYAKDVLAPFCKENGTIAVVTDFSPLRVAQQWYEDIGHLLDCQGTPLYQVDGHNIVPCWLASDKAEVGARTLRGKIHKHLPRFLTEFPQLSPNLSELVKKPSFKLPSKIDWEAAEQSLQVDRTVAEIPNFESGEDSALKVLMNFLDKKMKIYDSDRNNPAADALSNLSPYLHFGQIASQRCVWEANKFKSKHSKAVESFVEEICVRKELADNFCYNNPNYDNLNCAANWAQETLKLHKKDKRPFLYTLKEFEYGVTHDELWNACQLQMVRFGKMHGYMRMYWAKKILEWTASPEDALKFAIYLNDKYELDGRDPNGYTGCAWAICGVHDQGWKERSIFGKIRYMNYDGCKRKFNINAYVSKFPGAAPESAAFKENKKKAAEADKPAKTS